MSIMLRHCAECRDYLNVMLSAIMLNVFMLSVVMLNVVAPSIHFSFDQAMEQPGNPY